MRHFLILILFIFILLPIQSSAQKNFATQGEQEDYWATELFNNSYSKQVFDRYKGKITQLKNSQIRYDSTVIKVFTNKPPLKQIFNLGILYPGIFDDPRTLDPSTKNIRMARISNSRKGTQATDSSSKATYSHFESLFENDTLSISIIEEVPFLSKSSHIKRFRMWVYHKWSGNPTIYFFELTNEKGTDNSDLSDFVNGATLTFVRKGWLII
jgi:hypothetical protein